MPMIPDNSECLDCGAVISYAIAPIVDSATDVNSNGYYSHRAIDNGDIPSKFDLPYAELSLPISTWRLAG
jgi:hypothetical protein